MSRFWSHDLQVVLRGLQSVLNASLKLQETELKTVWNNSNVKTIVNDIVSKANENSAGVKSSGVLQNDITKNITETFERTSVVLEGLRALLVHVGKTAKKNAVEFEQKQHQEKPSTSFKQDVQDDATADPLVKSHTVEVKSMLNDTKEESTLHNSPSSSIDDPLLHFEKKDYLLEEPKMVKTSVPSPAQQAMEALFVPPLMQKTKQKTVSQKQQTLSATAKQRKVPSSRIARMVSFGSLAAGLGIGTIAEATRRSLGLANENGSVAATLDGVFLSQANAERIVDTLCKVRGAALKIGQILSIQDNTMISPTLQKAFERVRQSADFMPSWQVEKALVSELGADWNTKVVSFEMKPFAAASIGQVHLATIHDGTEVAMKIQYPGVAKGIKSDIDNLVGIMNLWNIFPEGLFIDNIVEVAKRELAWEVDYEREAECTKKFKKYLEPYPEYYVPTVIDELSSKQIFSTEMVDGIPVDKCAECDLETREHICRLVMQLCLRELFEFRYMQTDPNWSNFLYNMETRQLILLDFGASREYGKKFIEQYIQILRGAADGKRDVVLKLSQDIGFLTGYESKMMREAHVDAVMILGEVFRSSSPFNFGQQETTRQVQHLVPTMIKHRLCPPPEEIYSLHRKLSGIFLLCAKLDVKLECRSMFEDVYEKYMSAQHSDQLLNN